MKYLLIPFLLFTCFAAYAQDTLTVMQYNLLYYGNTGSVAACDDSINNIDSKDAYLKTIIQHVKPDVFCVNEMGNDDIYARRIRDFVLNQDGISYYKKAAFTNNGSSGIVNMLYYNAEKLVLHSQQQVDKDIQNNSLTRVIDIYRLYYNDPALSTHKDTVFINFIVAHLKAGNTTSDRAQRGKETEALMYYLDSINAMGNYVFSGDLNLYTSNEAAWQNITGHTNPKIKFYDPVDKAGSWSDNASFAAWHTQSTNITSGCKAGGGMDDRFDFILLNTYALNDSDYVGYIPGSYTTLGQDGNRFDQSLVSPANSSAPSAVINALHEMSDHLPVVVKLKVMPPGLSAISPGEEDELKAIIANPLINNELFVKLYSESSQRVMVELYDMKGMLVLEEEMQALPDGFYLKKPVGHLNAGLYFIRITGNSSILLSRKVVKFF